MPIQLIDKHSRNRKQTLSEEIASTLNITVAEITSKFHALRSQFNRECSKEAKQKSGSGSNEVYTSKWEYMSTMKFLKTKIVAGETVSSLVRFIHYFCLFNQNLIQ